MKDYFTVSQLADHFGVCAKTIYRQIWTKVIPVYKMEATSELLGGCYYVFRIFVHMCKDLSALRASNLSLLGDVRTAKDEGGYHHRYN